MKRTYLAALAAALMLFMLRPAIALPVAANVPGGIALIPLGTVLDSPGRPLAWLGDRPVWVAAADGHWIAVVGVPLDMRAGKQTLRVRANGGERTMPFEIGEKHYAEQRITLKDSSKVTLSPEDEARALAEIERIQALKKHWRTSAETETDFVKPVAGRLASRFGLRRIFNGEPRAPHSGLDIAARRGTPVGAPATGTVLAIDDYFFNGKTVFLDHGNGLLSMYCHLEHIDVKPGAMLRRGETLGRIGATGRASGPHLHWSVVLNGTMVDPELFLTRR